MAIRVELECDLGSLVADARRLLVVDPGRFQKLLTLCRAYLSIYEMPHESLSDLAGRLTLAPPNNAKPSA